MATEDRAAASRLRQPSADAWEARYNRALAERNRARFLAEHLFQMIDRETWRAEGAEWMGQYEGDHWAAKVEEEIRSWTK